MIGLYVTVFRVRFFFSLGGRASLKPRDDGSECNMSKYYFHDNTVWCSLKVLSLDHHSRRSQVKAERTSRADASSSARTPLLLDRLPATLGWVPISSSGAARMRVDNYSIRNSMVSKLSVPPRLERAVGHMPSCRTTKRPFVH
jgi:hypothetical protein